MKKNLKITHSQIYLGLLLAMAVSFPMSKALMSIVPGLLMLNWFIEGQFSLKLQRLRERKSVLLLISVFFVYLIGLLWTDNMQYGMQDVKIQLPLLVLPLVIGTSEELNYRQVKRIIYIFSAAVVVASFCSIWVLLGFSGKTIQNPREMSLFISHIRFALLINISIFSLGWYFLNPQRKSIAEKAFLILTIIWLSIFLFVLKSATGWVVYLTIWLVVIILGIWKIKKRIPRIGLSAILLLIILLPTVYIGHVVHQFYDVETLPANIASERSSKGNFYSQDFKNKQLENGHYTFLFVNENELREAWNKRSQINYDSTSASGFNRFVLIRYMTSKGYRKDAEGLEKLTGDDIRNIENGMTNYRFVNTLSFYNRIYQIVWELDVYKKGGNPSGHSVSQRLEYYKMAWQIIDDNFWFGHGTGGYYNAYQEQYDQNKFFQNQDYRQRSHNMFLSYWIDFGLIGLIYICFALVYPIIIERKTKSFLLMVFFLIVIISFINEDTLNNHDAITFFSFFYPLYLYSPSKSPLRESPIPNPSRKGKGQKTTKIGKS
ncbi:MAG TPA: O-antigen ligase family protein [Prolixibacteraceae bacterium]|nr:O-antigen ligase family protein [Prolixibacteraceae bacterium]